MYRADDGDHHVGEDDTAIIPRGCVEKYWREINEKSRRVEPGGSQ
jgi:hypothetical protein